MPRSLFKNIEYHGQIFKLSRAHSGFCDYKTNPVNLDGTEIGRIEFAICQAKISSKYNSRDELIVAVFSLQFPGYGLAQFGEKPQDDGTTLAGYSIEIPLTDKERVLTFRGQDGMYSLIDDFIYTKSPGELGIMAVEVKGRSLVYCSFEGRDLLTRAAANLD